MRGGKKLYVVEEGGRGGARRGGMEWEREGVRVGGERRIEEWIRDEEVDNMVIVGPQ